VGGIHGTGSRCRPATRAVPLAASPLREQLAPQSIPFASIVRCLVALVARSAYYRFFGRDCWPQGQLDGSYSAERAGAGEFRWLSRRTPRGNIYGVRLGQQLGHSPNGALRLRQGVRPPPGFRPLLLY
jgi:hypothetical protein